MSYACIAFNAANGTHLTLSVRHARIVLVQLEQSDIC